ncbi:MAG TPA: sugar ABC transporter ATP-binding protein [Candidatus Limnocylindrales bacterium]|nr:sugar ABC transporter ATP-binding protein [Candidatus Limnocylindrales bacterium]
MKIAPIELTIQHAVKRYGGVTALADGNLEAHSGEVLALLGANGSGKSTLAKIITGVIAPNEGDLRVDGQPVRFATPHAARALGISAVYQELSLVPDLTVAENIWLTHEPLRFGALDRREMRRRTAALLDLFAGTCKTDITPDTPITALPPDEKQIVEILKALSFEPRLMILDEATASLDSQQVNRLFELVKQWQADGRAVVFVSHRMEEIFRIADRATVLRNGVTVGTRSIAETNERELVTLMIEGMREFERRPAAETLATMPVRLHVEGLATAVLRGVSLELRDGELLGLGGLQGQGQSDLLMALFGAMPHSGSVTISGKSTRFRHPKDAIGHGVALVPGDRSSEGLLMVRSILENFQLPSWREYGVPIRMKQAANDGAQIAAEMQMVMSSLDAPVSSLSGGNAQKVVIGKWLRRSPKLLLLNDPTKGVDVGAKGEFYELLNQLRDRGTAILFYSSDDDELLGLCDRVLVMHDGAVRAELQGESLNREQLVTASLGAAS